MSVHNIYAKQILLLHYINNNISYWNVIEFNTLIPLCSQNITAFLLINLMSDLV